MFRQDSATPLSRPASSCAAVSSFTSEEPGGRSSGPALRMKCSERAGRTPGGPVRGSACLPDSAYATTQGGWRNFSSTSRLTSPSVSRSSMRFDASCDRKEALKPRSLVLSSAVLTLSSSGSWLRGCAAHLRPPVPRAREPPDRFLGQEAIIPPSQARRPAGDQSTSSQQDRKPP